MTIAKLCFGAAAVLFGLAMLGVATLWTGALGSVILLVAATSAAVAMEARDFADGGSALEAFLEDTLRPEKHAA